MSDTHDYLADGEQATDAEQYLTFVLGGEEFGVPILKVQEIKGLTTITPIPHAPPFVKGVMNLRGTVVPVIHLRERFGMPPEELSKFSVIVVVNVGQRVVGLIVDAVSDVLTVSDADLAEPPKFGANVDTAFITGMVKSTAKLALLLDIDRLVDADLAVPIAA